MGKVYILRDENDIFGIYTDFDKALSHWCGLTNTMFGMTFFYDVATEKALNWDYRYVIQEYEVNTEKYDER